MEINNPSGRKKAIEELMRGHELANQLLELVRHHGSNNGDDGLIRPSAEDLSKKILRSFTNTLLLLNTVYDSGEISLRDTCSVWNIACPNPEGKMKEKCKSLSIRNQRGCHKRKRNIETWEMDSPALVDDGHAWRKYGQKMTTNAKYLRNYYRCSYKYDQGCPAIKQVQRIQEHPPLYRTTCYGLHTCNNLLQLPEMILDLSSPPPSSLLLSFNSKNDHPLISPSNERQPKEEIRMEQNQLSLSGYQHELNYDSSRHVTVLSSTLESTNGDLPSSVNIDSFEMDDVLLRSLDFHDFVHFGP